MVKNIIPAIAILFVFSSCTTFKSLNFTSNKQVSNISVPSPPVKFIEEISVNQQDVNEENKAKQTAKETFTTSPLRKETKPDTKQNDQLLEYYTKPVSDQSVSSLDLKYSNLLNLEVEYLPSKLLLQNVDEWYGVRYRSGGISKRGVDCSGFTRAIYQSVYGVELPRVSREQYRFSRKISTTELQEGDLVFFNMKGYGVSHVGVYLGHNKFVHASLSQGVRVSDLFESYYIRRFVGGGRIENKTIVASN